MKFKLIKANTERFTVEREDWGKSDIYNGERDRMFYIYDNKTGIQVDDALGDTIYYDTLEEAQEECDELNLADRENKNFKVW